MNWTLLIPLLITTTFGMLGWFAGHWLSTSRDRVNKKRDIRITFLLEAYRRLEAASHRKEITGTKYAVDFESAIADIQLLGTPEQILLVKEVVKGIHRRDPQANARQLLLSLRNELREHLDLKPLDEESLPFRIEG